MNYKQAFAVGLIAPGVMAVREPVAYLYNGVRLPGLPESEYSFAVIAESTLGTYLSFGNVAPTWNGASIRFVDGVGTKYELDGDTWVFNTADNPNISWVAFSSKIIWANVDVVHSDTGNVVREASDPVPVYE